MVDFVFASIQKAFGNRDREGSYSLLLVVITLVALRLLHCIPCKEMRGRYRSVRIVIGYKEITWFTYKHT